MATDIASEPEPWCELDDPHVRSLYILNPARVRKWNVLLVIDTEHSGLNRFKPIFSD